MWRMMTNIFLNFMIEDFKNAAPMGLGVRFISSYQNDGPMGLYNESEK